MLRKDWLHMKADKKKMIFEVIFGVGYGCLIGWELTLQFDNPDLMGLGYLILILCCPTIFQQSASYISNQMVKDKETKMKETLKIMGLDVWVYSLAFLVQRGIWMTLPTFFLCLFIGLFNKNYFDTSTIVVLFIALWFFGMGMLAVAMLF